MKKKQLFYKESGKIDPLKQSMFYALGIIFTMLVGYFYSMLIIFIPLVYFNVLITTGLGLSIGLMCKAFVRLGHNRNKNSQFIQSVIFGLLANYFQWLTYMLYISEGATPNFGFYLANLDWIFTSGDFSLMLNQLAKFGSWGIAGFTINGFTLGLIWFVEFVLILGLPILIIFKTKIYPYSETFNRWYFKYTLTKDFQYIALVKQLINSVETNPLEALQSLDKGTAFRYSKIHVFYLKGETNHYLTFENILMEGEGNTDKNSSIEINNIVISKEMAEEILKTFSHKQELINVL